MCLRVCTYALAVFETPINLQLLQLWYSCIVRSTLTHFKKSWYVTISYVFMVHLPTVSSQDYIALNGRMISE